MKAEEFWNKVYDILVEECQAWNGEHDRAAFVGEQVREAPREWRFCGSLGFGGKFWRNADRMYVNCYQEDETPSRLLTIKRANKRLDKLRKKARMDS